MKVILSLGAGVQSTAMALACQENILPYKPDCAIFADTGAEPEAVYETVDKLKKILSFPVYKVMHEAGLAASLGGKNFASIPFFTKNLNTGEVGIGRRQCTKDFKIVPIHKKIRELYDINPRKDKIKMLIGISLDEALRMKPACEKWIENTYPLIEKKWNRNDCKKFLDERDFKTARSACVFCPYHSNAEWDTLEKSDMEFAIAIDEKIRTLDRRRKGNYENFLHRSCKPLDEVKFVDETPDMFAEECDGVCRL